MWNSKFLLILVVQVSVLKADLFPRRFKFPAPTEAMSRQIYIDVNTIDMPIDHFNQSNNMTFKMRYASRGDIFEAGGPLFVYIGGEQSLENQIGPLFSGIFYDMAQEKNAYMIATEHRYYGDSVPNGNLETNNMRWMTFAQALADLAYLIKDRKKNIPGVENSKVVVVGGSYPANLAAWMRLKYPDVVDAALASSGVLKIKVNNYEYNEVVQRDIMNNKPCLNTITDGVNRTRSMTRTTKGARQVTKDYNLCEPLNRYSQNEVRNVFNNIGVRIGNIAQYNNQGSFMTIDEMCTHLINNSDTENAYTRLYKFIRKWNDLYNKGSCISSFRQTIAFYRQTTPDNTRPWIYEICSSLGLLITTDSQNQPYLNTIPIAFWYSVCQETFGLRLNPASVNLGVSQTRAEYGAPSRNITKTVFVVGTVDPWSGVGVSESLNDQAPLFVVEGGSHCQDLQPYKNSDSQSLRDARENTKKYIFSWI